MRWKRTAAFFIATALAAVPAEAGHEWPIYSSFYPSVIEVQTVDPATAARILPKGGIHAYVGGVPAFDGPPPRSVATVDSLGGFVVVSVDPPNCTRLWGAVHDLAEHPRQFIFHPYPVTPLHADYLEEVDLAVKAAARARGAAQATVADNIRIVDADTLVQHAMNRFDGWSGPPWIKSGWFQAYQLLAGALPPATQKKAAHDLADLEHGDFDDLGDRYNAERTFVSLLTENCGRAVAGYTIRREAYDNDYYTGIENIAADSIAGLDSPVFIRTVKLKDYPWNGVLRLGVPNRPNSAWNPVAGFIDSAGRLIWSVLGDSAGLPAPYGAGWELDRMANITAMH